VHKIDARGKICPLPLFYTKKQIDGLKPGKELEVLKIEVPMGMEADGNEVIGVKQINKIDWEIIIKK